MGAGDLLYSTPALAFYKHYVFPRYSTKRMPTVDWSLGAPDLIRALARVTDSQVREVLEYELWSYRKLYASVGDVDQAGRLGNVHRVAFAEFSRSRWDSTATGTVGPPAEPQPVSLLPAQVSLLSRLLLGWLLATGAALLLLLADPWQRGAARRADRLAWFAIVLLFGVLGWVA